MTPVARALARTTQRLEAVSDTPRLDAELLMAEALGIERDRLILSPPSGPVPEDFAAMAERRAAGEPVAYITGRRAFWNIDLHVGPGVLVPRPDSEVLIETALEHFGPQPGPATIIDLGTGPGTLLLAALDLWPAARGVGIDASATALRYAEANARRLELGNRADFRTGDWAAGIDACFDLVLCNPPYVADDAALGPGVREHEPREALFAGPDGLDDYRRIIPALPGLIAAGGLGVIEIGFDQAQAVTALASAAGLSSEVRRDLGGNARCLAVRPA